MFKYLVMLLLILLTLGMSACTTPAAPTQPVEPVTLKIAVLPIIDALPMYVAQQEGFFQAEGIQVEFIPVASAAERDQIISAEKADGMINEIIATLLYNKEQVQVQIVRLARVATSTSSQYHILVSSQSGFTKPQDLIGVEIGISQGTIIDYITNRLLEAEGLTSDQIKTMAVPKIPDRLALLSSGELKAATLPDPFSFLAVQQGAVVLLEDSSHPEYGHSTYAFRKAVIDEHPDAIRAFLAAIEQAVAKINANPSSWSALLDAQKLVPAPLIGSYTIPPFPSAGVPSQVLWGDVLAWAKFKGLVEVDIAYDASVNPDFLPKP